MQALSLSNRLHLAALLQTLRPAHSPSCHLLQHILVLCRLKADNSKAADVEKLVKSLPPEIASSYNIGLADFYPATSGKQNAAAHIVQKLESDLQASFLLCDDDNDMGNIHKPYTLWKWLIMSYPLLVVHAHNLL